MEEPQGREESRNYPFPMLSEQDLFWENDELSSLLLKEEQNPLYDNTLESNENNVAGRVRLEAVVWMLKFNAHYFFSALTALLAVNYLVRFLFSIRFQTDQKPWMTQLVAVACLSPAAEVEEVSVMPKGKFTKESKRPRRSSLGTSGNEIVVYSPPGSQTRSGGQFTAGTDSTPPTAN